MIKLRHIKWLIATLVASILCAGIGLAQEEEDDDAASSEDVMEEIVVVVDRSGDYVDVDALRLEKMREEVIRDFTIAQEEQDKEAWRQDLQSSISNPESRISWGYDAQSEAAMRRSAVNELPMDGVQPATVITVSF